MAKDSTYNPEEVSKDTILRVSKSSYNQYAKCPRQYWWSKIALPDTQIPSSPEAIRGTAIHQVMEDSLREVSEDKKANIVPDINSGMTITFNKHAVNQKVEYDIGVDSLREILEEIAHRWGHLEIIELEDKHAIETVVDYQGETSPVFVPVVLVGMIDAVFKHPDGHLVIVELKTGNANQSKLSRTRGELAYYRKLLMLKGYTEPITHILTIFPDAQDADFLLSMIEKKNTDVFCGETQGMGIYEPLGTRTINAMEKKLSKSIKGIMEGEWGIKWNEYFCTQWCEFHLSCNEEMLGVSND